ncbi:hypothetical protein [Streptomyces sp. NPDC018031]|uniref:hypothetical protein n=1 Tax=Streptomyces sp. NPDC018031 TaxID=3365033 RepID=UPI0037B95105
MTLEELSALEDEARARRELAGRDPAAHLAALAETLNTLCRKRNSRALRSGLPGSWDDLLIPYEEAVTVHRTLAGTAPDRFLPGLAESLHNVALPLGEVGRLPDAVSCREEAVALYRTLAATDPAGYLPRLGWTLRDLAVDLRELGRGAASEAARTEAEHIRRTPAGPAS